MVRSSDRLPCWSVHGPNLALCEAYRLVLVFDTSSQFNIMIVLMIPLLHPGFSTLGLRFHRKLSVLTESAPSNLINIFIM